MACTAPVLRVLLDCPTSRLETPAASTTCHYPAPPEYDCSPSNEGILECPEHACTSRRLPQPRRSFSLPAALPAGTARVPPRRPMRQPDRRLQTATMPRHSSRPRRTPSRAATPARRTTASSLDRKRTRLNSSHYSAPR